MERMCHWEQICWQIPLHICSIFNDTGIHVQCISTEFQEFSITEFTNSFYLIWSKDRVNITIFWDVTFCSLVNRYLSSKLYGITRTSQMTIILLLTAVRTSNLTRTGAVSRNSAHSQQYFMLILKLTLSGSLSDLLQHSENHVPIKWWIEADAFTIQNNLAYRVVSKYIYCRRLTFFHATTKTCKF
jgi:hypothetical protein